MPAGIGIPSRTFQSTPPARGATILRDPLQGPERHFNPRPPRGGRHQCSPPSILKFSFQSTPPARGATALSFIAHNPVRFQSTPPARGATLWLESLRQGCEISIHAPREGGDGIPWRQTVEPTYFNPRPPRGGRRRTGYSFDRWDSEFQSTPPARGATTASPS